MTEKEFNKIVKLVFDEITQTLGLKASDYATKDRLANFKMQANIDGITPTEALRGNWLKHRASIVQGLNELQQGKIRPLDWWKEKLGDDRNYNILLYALLREEFFDENS